MRSRINCNDRLWKQFLLAALGQGQEIDLVNVDDVEDGPFCDGLAKLHAMVFSINGETGYGSFTKRTG